MEVVHKAIEAMQEMYTDKVAVDQFLNLAQMYMESIDKDGFVFDFDHLWQICGYSTKASAKRVLVRVLQENENYLIFLPQKEQSVSILPGKNNLPGPSTKKLSGLPGGPDVVQNGGQNREIIKLTAKGLGQFALAAQTENGRMLRDFLMQLIICFKRFTKAVASGEIEVRRREPPPGAERDAKRLKVTESQKTLMNAVHERPGLNAGDYARINGITNKVVTGRYKYELAKELGLPASSVNARDYMSPVQLVGAEFLEMVSAEHLQKNPGADALEVHEEVAQSFHANFKRLYSSEIPQKRSLKDVRREQTLKLTNAKRSKIGHFFK
jgi:hypothetical protein